MRSLFNCRAVVAASLLVAMLCTNAGAAEKLPPEKAGEIGQRTGKIAFIRDKNIWTMDAHGGHQMLITEVTNADGRITWSTDGKRILFTRSGRIQLNGPDLLGGKHKVYDLFMAFIDSAEIGNTNFWYRLTDDLGSRDPEWSADDSIVVFTKDMHAKNADAAWPNYQVCTMNPDGSDAKILRKDWQKMSEFFMSPTMNTEGDIVFVHFYDKKPQGLAKLPRDHFMVSLDSVKVQSTKMSGAVAPTWSPDGRWIAWVSNSIADAGVYISPPDFSEKYLVFVPPPGTSLYTMAPSFSPNSKWLTFATTDGSIWVCDITGNGATRLSGPGLDCAPAWSKGSTAPPASDK